MLDTKMTPQVKPSVQNGFEEFTASVIRAYSVLQQSTAAGHLQETNAI